MSSILVTGASRGLGLELARQYAATGWRVLATCREPGKAVELAALEAAEPQLDVYPLDVTRADQIDSLSQRLRDEPIDVLLLNAGIYGPKGLAFGEVDAGTWLEVLAVNSVAPWMIAQALMPQLLRGERRIIAALSSKVGSLADNRSGRNVPYRSSKAALNQAVKTMSIELAPRGVVAVALHPGWVRTEMGGPNALIEADESVRGLRAFIDALGPEHSGRFFAWDGSEIPW